MTLGAFVISNLWRLIALALLVVCSGFFSGSETALFSLSRADLLRYRQTGGAVGRTIDSLMRHPRRLLMVILLGNQLVNVAFFAIATTLMLDLGDVRGVGRWRTLLLPAPLILIILLGEVCPKNLAVSKPRSFAKAVSGPLAVLVKLLGPLQRAFSTFLIDPLTRLLAPARPVAVTLRPSELSELLELSSRRGLISPNEWTWLQEVIQLGRRKVADIMVPRVDIVAYDVDAPAAGLVQLFRQTGLVKIPVHRGDLDNTLGVVYAKELLLAPDRQLATLVKPALYVPETGAVDKLLDQFRRNKTQMALVVDEYGGVAGLVTLEDALEEIVGDIVSDGEPAPNPVRSVGPGEWLIDGNLAVHDWADVFEIDLTAERISTIGGVVMELLDRVPRAGDVTRTGNLEFTVESMRGHRIRLLRLRMLEERS